MLLDVNIKEPIKFINNVNASFVSNPSDIKSLLIKQVSQEFVGEKSIHKASTLNLRFYNRDWSGKVLTGLNKRINVNAEYFNIYIK